MKLKISGKIWPPGEIWFFALTVERKRLLPAKHLCENLTTSVSVTTGQTDAGRGYRYLYVQLSFYAS